MIYKATQAIADAFARHDLKCGIAEEEGRSVIKTGFNGDNGSYNMLFISRDDDNDVAFRMFNYVQFPERVLADMISIAADMNKKFRYLRFCVDVEGLSIDLEYDFPMSTDDPGETAVEMARRSVHIADEAYPEIMRAIYGGNN